MDERSGDRVRRGGRRRELSSEAAFVFRRRRLCSKKCQPPELKQCQIVSEPVSPGIADQRSGWLAIPREIRPNILFGSFSNSDCAV
jgi:hypothetical protein